jgi:hypothetical protein
MPVPYDWSSDGACAAASFLGGRTLFMIANEWHGYENIGKGPRT